MGDLSPFDFFRQETSHLDAVVRTEAMGKVAVIAAIMGPERTRSDMLPYLQTKIDDLDQVLLVLAGKLSKFLPLVGGPDQAHSLIPLIEALCDIEEIEVRTAVGKSAAKILKQLNPNNKVSIQSFFECTKRLSNEEAGEVFYSRVSCCSFLPELYALLSDVDRVVLREIFTRLSKDELPIVRRATVLIIVELGKLVDNDTLQGELLTIFKALVGDESQTIQSLAIEYLGGFAQLLKNVGNTTAITAEMLPLVKQYADDPSWRLRLSLAKGFGKLPQIFLPAEVGSEVFACLIHLLQDPEPEVRTIAIQEILPFLDVVGTTQFIGELSPVAVQLSEDPVPNMRKLLAELCIDIATKTATENTTNQLSDIIIKLIEDEDPLVRLRIIKKLSAIAEEVPSLCTRLTEYLKAMFNNNNWRVRKELVLAMPAIVKHMGQDYFVDHFLSLFLQLLQDSVDEVRIACAGAIPQIAAVSSMSWVYEKIFPAVKAMSNDDYLIRLTMLTALHGLVALELSHNFQNDLILLIVNSTRDKVPNIRIRAAQLLHIAIAHISLDSAKSQIQQALTDLQQDKDKDVKYFALHPPSKLN